MNKYGGEGNALWTFCCISHHHMEQFPRMPLGCPIWMQGDMCVCLCVYMIECVCVQQVKVGASAYVKIVCVCSFECACIMHPTKIMDVYVAQAKHCE